jgi:GTP-binding protein EngB required for normal cell division
VKDLDRNTAYMQQWRVLSEKYGKPLDPRKQTLIDLKKFLREEKQNGREVVLMLDANEEVKNRTDEMIETINECEMIDVHAKSDPLNEVETYVRGKQRIDYMMATERVAECVEYTNIAPYNKGIVSDHRALAIDINSKKLHWET